MDPTIVPYKPSHQEIIKILFPPEWNFDFSRFVSFHLEKNYFHGFTLLDHTDPIGFGNLMIFGTVCWIGNIVVAEEQRNKGHGTGITQFLMKKGKELGAKSFNLVATQIGEPIYRKLGFVTEFNYEFFKPDARIEFSGDPVGVRKAHHSDLAEILKLDREITGENRAEMINLFLPWAHVLIDRGGLTGYLLSNLGDGLVLANHPDSGLELLKMKIRMKGEQVVIPEVNEGARRFLLDLGFKKTMELPRMIAGDKYNWFPESVFSRGTGYCG